MGILIDFAVLWSYWTLFFKTEKLSSGIRCHCFYEFMIEKYAEQMDLDALPDPRQQSRLKGIEEVYRRYMRLSAEARQAA